MMDPVYKQRHRKEVYPKDCERAYVYGHRLAEKTNE